jgi:hypothetical protein
MLRNLALSGLYLVVLDLYHYRKGESWTPLYTTHAHSRIPPLGLGTRLAFAPNQIPTQQLIYLRVSSHKNEYGNTTNFY